MIIGLTGAAGSGKDTVGAFLIKEYKFERRAFADPLKRSVAALFDIPFSQVDELKNTGATVQLSDIKAGQRGTFTWREFLQRYGTEAHRDIFEQDFWLDATLPVGPFYGGRAIVVTDVRFANEVERIKMLGGHVIRISRPPFERLPHRSEQELLLMQVDYDIVNDGTIEELYEKVDEVIGAVV